MDGSNMTGTAEVVHTMRGIVGTAHPLHSSMVSGDALKVQEQNQEEQQKNRKKHVVTCVALRPPPPQKKCRFCGQIDNWNHLYLSIFAVGHAVILRYE